MLATTEMLGGIVVDLQVGAALGYMRKGSSPPADLPERGVVVWRRMLATSENQAEMMRSGETLPMNAQPLLAHYYGRKFEAELAERIEERVVRSLKGFLNSGVLARMAQTSPERWMPERREWEPAARLWELEGAKVWSNLDFWIDYGDRGFVVLDWKTGSYVGPEEALQLATYSVFVQVTKGLPREKVLVQAAHLPMAPDWDAKPVSEAACDAMVQTVKADMAFEMSLLGDAENEKGERVLWAERSKFPVEPAPNRCVRCRFLEICPEGRAYVEEHREVVTLLEDDEEASELEA